MPKTDSKMDHRILDAIKKAADSVRSLDSKEPIEVYENMIAFFVVPAIIETYHEAGKQ